MNTIGHLRRKRQIIYLMCVFLNLKIRGNEKRKKYFSLGNCSIWGLAGTWIQQTDLFSNPSFCFNHKMKIALLQKFIGLVLAPNTSDQQQSLFTAWCADSDKPVQALTEMLPQNPSSSNPTLLYLSPEVFCIAFSCKFS